MYNVNIFAPLFPMKISEWQIIYRLIFPSDIHHPMLSILSNIGAAIQKRNARRVELGAILMIHKILLWIRHSHFRESLYIRE